jgi:hypothetical protein
MAKPAPPSVATDTSVDRVENWMTGAPVVVDLEQDDEAGGLPIKEEVVVKQEGEESGGERPSVSSDNLLAKLPPSVHWEEKLDILDDWIPTEAVVDLEVEDEERGQWVEWKVEKTGSKKHFVFQVLTLNFQFYN